MINNKTIRLIIRSYLSALLLCLIVTGINAAVDYKNPYVSDSLAELALFHFLSALGYAIPVSALVFFVMRNPSRQVRIQKAMNIVTYILLTIIGGFLGSYVVGKIIYDFDAPGTGGLDDILPWTLGMVTGAALLPLSYFLFSRYRKQHSSKNPTGDK
jgi:hypothetical protein